MKELLDLISDTIEKLDFGKYGYIVMKTNKDNGDVVTTLIFNKDIEIPEYGENDEQTR